MTHFLKSNQSKYPDQLFKEAEGLKLIASEYGHAHSLKTPEVFKVNEKEIELEMIQTGPFTFKAMSFLGRELAKLHQIKKEYFGFRSDNYIGLSPQKNTREDNWGVFFLNHRLLFQINLIKDQSVKDWFYTKIISVEKDLITYLNQHNPHASIVHGDLWSGNVLINKSEEVYLIDPALYYGDREVDLAMSTLFGGFTPDFYEAYQKEYPLSENYQIRFEIYNLYHILNHYNLFGDSYLNQAKRIVEKLF